MIHNLFWIYCHIQLTCFQLIKELNFVRTSVYEGKGRGGGYLLNCHFTYTDCNIILYCYFPWIRLVKSGFVYLSYRFVSFEFVHSAMFWTNTVLRDDLTLWWIGFTKTSISTIVHFLCGRTQCFSEISIGILIMVPYFWNTTVWFVRQNHTFWSLWYRP